MIIHCWFAIFNNNTSLEIFAEVLSWFRAAVFQNLTIIWQASSVEIIVTTESHAFNSTVDLRILKGYNDDDNNDLINFTEPYLPLGLKAVQRPHHSHFYKKVSYKIFHYLWSLVTPKIWKNLKNHFLCAGLN